MSSLPDMVKKIKETQHVILSEVSSKKNQIQITNPFISSSLQSSIKDKAQICRTWRLSKKNVETEIKVGDIIKLGRVRLKFDNIILNSLQSKNTNLVDNSNIFFGNTITNINNSVNNDESVDNGLNKENFADHGSAEEKYICRICYCGVSDKSDPLIVPCKCTGSMNYIHYRCLKHCIESKIQRKVEPNYVFLTWKNFECEICGEEYPKYLKYKSHIYNMVDLNVDYREYAVCDYALFDDNKKKTFRRGIIAFKIGDDFDVSIGRTQSNKIKLKDISVSRMHCSIFKKGPKLFVVDKGSKFGTLIYLNKSLTLNYGESSDATSSELVTGKHCFTITIKKNWEIFKPFFSWTCCTGKAAIDNDFVDQEENVDIINSKEKEEENKNLGEALTVVGNRKNDDSYEDYILDIGTIIKE